MIVVDSMFMAKALSQAGYRRVVSMDVETADSYRHIVEIAAVEVIDGEIGACLVERVRPATKRMKKRCFAVHGISLRDVAGAPGFEAVLPRFADFVGDAPILAHNKAAEIKSIQFECARLGLDMPFSEDRFHCTMRMGRVAGLTGPLREMCASVGVAVNHLARRHDAGSDAEMAARLFVVLAERARQAEVANPVLRL